jgi:ribosomal protein L7/L12
MKKNLTIVLILFLFIGLILLTGFIFPILINAFFYQPYLKSIVIFVVFAIVVFQKRLTWDNYIMIPVAVVTVIGTFMDTSGNVVFNKPLEWMFSSIGQLQIDTSVYNYAPGEYSITDHLRILKDDGQIMEIHTVFLYLYRFAQYLIFYVIAAILFGALVKLLPDKKVIHLVKDREEMTLEMRQKIEAEKRKRENEREQRLILSEEVRTSVKVLISSNDIIKAIKLVREHTDLSLGDAKKLVEELENEMLRKEEKF